MILFQRSVFTAVISFHLPVEKGVHTKRCPPALSSCLLFSLCTSVGPGALFVYACLEMCVRVCERWVKESIFISALYCNVQLIALYLFKVGSKSKNKLQIDLMLLWAFMPTLKAVSFILASLHINSCRSFATYSHCAQNTCIFLGRKLSVTKRCNAATLVSRKTL